MKQDKQQQQVYDYSINKFVQSDTYKNTKNPELAVALADRYGIWKVERFSHYRQYPEGHHLRSEFDDIIKYQNNLEDKLNDN